MGDDRPSHNRNRSHGLYFLAGGKMSENVSRASLSYSCNVEAQIEQKRLGRRRKVFHGGTLCSGCYLEPPLPGQRYGANCHSNYEADRRKAERAELKRLRIIHSTDAEDIATLTQITKSAVG